MAHFNTSLKLSRLADFLPTVLYIGPLFYVRNIPTTSTRNHYANTKVQNILGGMIVLIKYLPDNCVINISGGNNYYQSLLSEVCFITFLILPQISIYLPIITSALYILFCQGCMHQLSCYKIFYGSFSQSSFDPLYILTKQKYVCSVLCMGVLTYYLPN